MDRRTFQRVLAAALLSLPFAAIAQQDRKIPRIAFLRGERPPQTYLDAFEEGLRQRGYAPGKDILIEYRFSDGDPAKLAMYAAELVNLKFDVIVAGGAQATRAIRNATSTIPIVMSSATDPVGNGFVASLAHPGGNVTGISVFAWDLIGKRIELLREILPKASRIAVLANRNSPAPPGVWNDALAAAATIGVNLQRVEVQSPSEFDDAFAAMARAKAEALIVVQTTLFDTPPYRIVQLAASNRIPAIYSPRIQADAGGLMSYGQSIRDSYRYASVFVDKILKGAKPSDLPVEQPVKFEMVINLKTAKALGLTMPQSLLVRADEVIQ